MRGPLAVLLLALGACHPMLDPEESGSLALGQNLYRVGQLTWSAPGEQASCVGAQAEGWSRVLPGLEVSAATPSGGRAGRVLVRGLEDAEVQTLLQPLGLQFDGAVLQVGTHAAPLEECDLVAVLRDPEDDSLPLNLVSFGQPARLPGLLEDFRPGWRREVLLLRDGLPWLWIDQEGGSPTPKSLTAVDEAAFRELAREGEPVERILAPAGFEASLLDAAVEAVEEALLARLAGEGWTLIVHGVLPRRPAEALAFGGYPRARLLPSTRRVELVLPNLASLPLARYELWRLVLRSSQPDAPSWWVDAQAARSAGLEEWPRIEAEPTAGDPLAEQDLMRFPSAARLPWLAARVEEERGPSPPPKAEFASRVQEAGPSTAEKSRPRVDAPLFAFLAADETMGTAQGDLALERLDTAGFDAVAIAYDLCTDPDPRLGRAFQPRRALEPTCGDLALEVVAAQARAHGLEVQLWPRILVARSGPSVGRVHAVRSSEREALFEALRAGATHAACLGERVGAGWIGLGRDLGDLVYLPRAEVGPEAAAKRADHEAGWEAVLRALRSTFGGGLVVALPDFDRVLAGEVSQGFDAVGVEYFPRLTGTEGSELRDLRSEIRQDLAQAGQAAQHLGKGLWVGPSGFRARRDAGRGPGEEGSEVDPKRRRDLLALTAEAAARSGAAFGLWRVAAESDPHHAVAEPGDLGQVATSFRR